MKALQLAAPGGLDHLHLTTLPDAPPPAAGEIQVRIHATSLNYHDLLVVSRPGATADGRIPMADGAGMVTAVGAGVTSVLLFITLKKIHAIRGDEEDAPKE